jgi:hypothetical protein
LAARLKARGFTARQVLAFAYSLSLVGAVGGIALVLTELPLAVVILGVLTALFVAAFLWLFYACPPPASPANPAP